MSEETKEWLTETAYAVIAGLALDYTLGLLLTAVLK